ncbi:hypothetical protein QJS66_11955 [Kocuria rhizophila]|nr:hypothetical protein QJS66_11955 [Kocuria rhizophila]
MIISGGENISSIEVEQALLLPPRRLDVAVVGVAHEKWGTTWPTWCGQAAPSQRTSCVSTCARSSADSKCRTP